jgi:hypothetical protein
MSEQARLSTQVNRGVAWAGASQAIIAVADLISHAVVIALWVSAGDYGLAMIALPLYTMLDTAADLPAHTARRDRAQARTRRLAVAVGTRDDRFGGVIEVRQRYDDIIRDRRRYREVRGVQPRGA